MYCLSRFIRWLACRFFRFYTFIFTSLVFCIVLVGTTLFYILIVILAICLFECFLGFTTYKKKVQTRSISLFNMLINHRRKLCVHNKVSTLSHHLLHQKKNKSYSPTNPLLCSGSPSLPSLLVSKLSYYFSSLPLLPLPI